MGLALDEPQGKDLKIVNGIEIIAEDRILNYLGGIQIDYISNEYGEGFSITPAYSVGGSCSC